MASIYHHKNRGFQVRYKIYLPDGSSLTRYRYAHTDTDANDLRVKCEYLERGSRRADLSPGDLSAAVRDGLISEADVILVSGGRGLVPFDLERVMAQFATSSSLRNSSLGNKVVMDRARHIREWLEKHPIPSLTENDIKNYVLGRRDGRITYFNRVAGKAKVGVALKTIKLEVTILSHIIDEAVALNMVKENVTKDVRIPFRSKKKKRALSRDEVARIISTAWEHRNLGHGYAYQIVMFVFYTGFRRGEISVARWSDYNPAAQTITVEAKEISDDWEFTPKSGEPAVIDLPAKLCSLLDAMERKGPYIFGGDVPYPPRFFYFVFKMIAQKAGIESTISLHHARHTYGSHLLQMTGGDLSYVKDQLRHLSITSTNEYSHTVPSESSPVKDLDYGDALEKEGRK